MTSMNYWKELYKKFKFEALCIDIETTEFDGEISIISMYRPKEGVIECESLVKGQNLNLENLREAFIGCKLIITFNGLKFDIPKIQREFPGAIPPNVPILDLYLISRKIFKLNLSLKTLENTFYISRPDSISNKRGIALKLWKRYASEGDEEALKQLIEYNRQDAVNLYFLAERLIV